MQNNTSLNTIPPQGHNNPPSEIDLLKEKLKEKHKSLLDNARSEIENLRDNIPQIIESEEQNAELADMIKNLTGIAKKVESTRVAEKEYFLQGGKVVDGFFKLVIDTIDKTKRAAQVPITNYLTKQAEAERERKRQEAAAAEAAAKAKLETAVQLEGDGLNKAAEKTLDQAQALEQQAQKAAEAVTAKPAELASTRGSMSLAGLRTRWVGEVRDYAALDLEKLRPFINRDALDKAVNQFVSNGGRELTGAAIFEKTDSVIR